ncbi:MAG: S8 family serine peptidase [bacterium]
MQKFFKTAVILFFIFTVITAQNHKINPNVINKLNTQNSEEKVLVWVFFTDKGNDLERYFSNPLLALSQKSINRRAKLHSFERGLDVLDIPVNSEYLKSLNNFGVIIKNKSRWLNGISCYVNQHQLNMLINLNFVKNIDLVEKYKSIQKIKSNFIESSVSYKPKGINSYNYGESYTQLQQINVPAVHDLGINGQGIVVGVLDAGFSNLPHEAFANMNIIAAYDFVNNDPNVGDGSDMGEGSHGTETLSTIGGFKDGKLIGPAFGASFILAKTENTDSETPVEEDNWIAGIEWMDSIGVDVTSTSLGYIDFDSPYQGYTWQSMNGNTCRITIAADLAVSRGIVCVNSAGNEGSNSSHNTLGAPADGDSVISVGAVESSGTRVYFSSVGPTVDGRIKPDVMAMGSNVRVASPSNVTGYTNSDGTSFSGPLAGGVAALILSACPTLTPMQVRDAMRNTASMHSNPNNEYGWGILDALAAINYFRVQIIHTPLTDTENPNRQHKVTAKFSSELPLTLNSMFLYYSVNNSSTYDSVAFLQGLPTGYYDAIIPVNTNNVIVKYYIKAKNSSNVYSLLPQNAPSVVFSFKIGADTTPPVVMHGALGPQSYFTWPSKIEADVTDNLAVKQVYVKFKINNVDYPDFNLVKNIGTSVYSAHFPVPQSSVNVGDVVSYKIVALDSALTPNTVYTPVVGYNTFSLENVVIYSNNFDSNNGDLTGNNDWQWGTTTSPYPTAHSGSKLWGTKLISNYTQGALLSTLETPAMQVVDNNAAVTFWHWYSVESDYDGCNVKISVNGGPFTLITPVGGYPGTISTSYDNPLAGQAAYVNDAIWSLAQFNLNGIVASGNSIKLRFEFGSDLSIVDKGWYIDDLAFTGVGMIVPVELTSFNAAYNDGKVELQWLTATEDNNSGFEIEASSDGNNFSKIGFVPGFGTSTEIHSYKFVDSRDLSANNFYRLKQIDYNGTINISQVIEVNTGNNFDYCLEQNYPNPFNPSTKISFSLKEEGQVNLYVYDVLGAKVANLVNGTMKAGKHSVVLNAAQFGLTSGIYFVTLEAGSIRKTIKSILMK